MRTESNFLGAARLLKEERPSPSTHKGHWKLYDVDPPLDGHSRVVVSAVDAFDTGDETYIFPGELKDDGINITDFGELTGSFKGEQNHEKALNYAGYEVKNG